MATYVIGDVQGCYAAFCQLLTVCQFDRQKDRLWLVGDVVNRGPDSLALLRYIYEQQDVIRLVLGNHDLYLLMLYAGAVREKAGDTLAEVLNAADAPILMDWLRQQPLCFRETIEVQGYAVVHAGLLPNWRVSDALRYSAEVSQVLQGADYQQFLRSLWGGRPETWDEQLSGIDRLRVIVNVLTRLRFCTPSGKMEFSSKGGLAQAPSGYFPWFTLRHWENDEDYLITGHWSALGYQKNANHLLLDSGYLWGGQLSAYRIEDGALFQIICPPEDALGFAE